MSPDPDGQQYADAEGRDGREPRDAALSVGSDNERREQRSERLADVAGRLEERLAQTWPRPRGGPREQRRLRMKDGGADANETHGKEQPTERVRLRDQRQPQERRPHTERQGVGMGPAIGPEPHERLEQGGGD